MQSLSVKKKQNKTGRRQGLIPKAKQKLSRLEEGKGEEKDGKENSVRYFKMNWRLNPAPSSLNHTLETFNECAPCKPSMIRGQLELNRN